MSTPSLQSPCPPPITLNASYHSLDSSQEEIRVLVIPPETSNPPNYSFLHVSLLSDVKYEALSYAWGDVPAKNAITIDGTPYPIRENLFSALKALRLRGSPRYVWVDALCINQADCDERNSQVSLMSSIYARASEVLIWLGTAGRDYWGAMALIDTLGHPEASEKDLRRKIEAYADISHTKFWTELSLLCHRPYWKRLWIIQEVVLASKIKAHCSSLKFEWEHLDWLFRRLADVVRTTQILYMAAVSPPGSGGTTNASRYTYLLQTILDIEASVPARLCKRRLEIAKQIPLVDLFLIHKEALCSEPRDRFFGFYSLAMSCCKKATPADYKKSLGEVLSTVAAHHFRFHVDKKEVVWKFREFREELIRAFPVQDGFAHELTDDSGVLKAIGNIHGKLIWTSPPLNTLSFPDYLSSFVDEMSKIDFTPALEEKLNHLTYLLRKGNMHSGLLNSTDLACDFCVLGTPNFSAFYPANPFSSNLNENLNVDGEGNADGIVGSPLQRILSPSKRQRTTTLLTNTLFHILSLAPSSENCKVFLEENGLMGYCSFASKEGDKIVRLIGSEAMVVVRDEGGGGKVAVVGRGTGLFRKGEEVGKWDGEIDRPVVLRMGLVALRVLAMGEVIVGRREGDES